MYVFSEPMKKKLWQLLAEKFSNKFILMLLQQASYVKFRHEKTGRAGELRMDVKHVEYAVEMDDDLKYFRESAIANKVKGSEVAAIDLAGDLLFYNVINFC